MNQTIKDLLKPPFELIKNKYISNGKIIINVTMTYGNANCFTSILTLLAEAINEKYQKDLGKPKRWILPESSIDYRCPICEREFYISIGEIAKYKYCPSCGQKLDPP